MTIRKAFTVLTAALLFPTACLASEKTITLAITSPYETLNPYGSSGVYTDVISDQIFDRLLVSNIDGSTEPRLAERYETTPDHTSITYYLDKNARFHDGVPVTADDVVYSARLDADPRFRSLKRSQLRYFAGTDDSGAELSPGSLAVEKLDDHAVRFTFKEPMNELPVLTMFNRYFYVLPKHIYGNYAPEELNSGSFWKEHLMGSGPLKYDSSIDGERVEFVANKDYFLGAPDADRVILRVVEGSQLITGILTGEVDVVMGGGAGSVPLADWPFAKENPDITTYSGRTYSYQSFIFNTQSPKMPSAKIRRAINMAINRQVQTDSLFEGEASVMYGPYQSYHPFYAAGLDEPAYNPEEALRLLNESGYDFSQTLEIMVTFGNETRIQSAALIQQDLAKVGVRTKIVQFDFATLMQKMRDGDFDFGMCGSAGSIDPSEPFGWLNWKGPTNFPCIADDTYALMYNDAMYELDPAKQKEKYSAIQAYELEDSPIAYLYSPNALIAYNGRRLSGLTPDRFGQLNWTIWEWKIKD